MTETTAPLPGYRVRIAIASPDIVANIRAVFANRGYDVHLDGEGHPVLDLLITPSAGAGPAGPGAALSRLVGARTRSALVPSARYRLALVGTRRDDAVTSPAPCRADGPTSGTAIGSRADSLTAREAQVMSCVAEGMRNVDIASSLAVSEKTVKNHVNRIFAKLAAHSRVEAVLAWQAERPGPVGERRYPPIPAVADRAG